jgi:hypothetical protein
MAKIDPTNISTAYLAECLGMTRDGVTRLCRQGVIRQNGVARGKYNLFEAVEAYATYLKESKGDESAVRLLRQRERKLRLANDKTEAGLVSIEDAAQTFATFASMFREFVTGQIEGMAARIAECDEPRTAGLMLKNDLETINKTVTDGVMGAFENER